MQIVFLKIVVRCKNICREDKFLKKLCTCGVGRCDAAAIVSKKITNHKKRLDISKANSYNRRTKFLGILAPGIRQLRPAWGRLSFNRRRMLIESHSIGMRLFCSLQIFILNFISEGKGMPHGSNAVQLELEDYRKQVRVVLQEAVESLRKTKSSYKCREIARVRKTLEETLKKI